MSEDISILKIDPGRGKRIKGSWYDVKKQGVVKWLGHTFSCAHGRERNKCKECGGVGICEHGRRRSLCKECGGSEICEHGRYRSQCKECGGSQICEHGRQRSVCKECGGVGICAHGRVRSSCKECGGSQICEHGRVRFQCKECGGGGICAHGRARNKCHACLVNASIVAEKATAKNDRCNDCAIQISAKRQVSKGGIGICAGCEEQKKAEARENGSSPPPKGESWETHFFGKLLSLVTYEDGVPFPPDQRDQREGGGLGTSKSTKRRRECDTTTNRFPDCAWVLRNAQGRATLVVVGECDENSHGDRGPECEGGKIDDTFQSLQQVLAKEGAAHGAVARHGACMVPIVFVKTNPNAYDGPKTNLDARVEATAALINSYLHKSQDQLKTLQTCAPIVHILYYHSKQGAKNLAYFESKSRQTGWQFSTESVVE